MPVETRDPYAGQINAADVDAARQHSTGNVWLMPRRVSITGRDTCNGSCQERAGCNCAPDTVPVTYRTGWLDSCAPEGGKHAEPVPSARESMRRHDRIRLVVLLASAATVVGVIAAAIYARWPMAWPLG